MPTETTSPRVLIGPDAPVWLTDAVIAGGGTTVTDTSQADALVWRGSDHRRLSALLTDAPNIRWVQLGAAGTDAWAPTRVFDDGRVWTSAKGSYSEAVAEQALALTLALLRELPRFARAKRWLPQAGRSLFGSTVLVLGAGGGIGAEVIRLLNPFRTHLLRGYREGITDSQSGETLCLSEALSAAEVVILATPLTPATRKLLGRAEFAVMKRDAIVINIARGAVIDTDALIEALTEGTIAAAGLDVTDPEPLPEGHPLWALENCLITPHTANTPEMLQPQLARRITDNVIRFTAGHPLIGVIDAAKGY